MKTTQDILAGLAPATEHAFPADQTGTSARNATWYLAHTDKGESIRSIARASGTAPSTISRAVRKIEHARDDPLFDRLIMDVEKKSAVASGGANRNTKPREPQKPEPLQQDALTREAKKYLRRLSEPGAFLLIAQGTEKAGVFCASNQHSRPIAMLPVNTAAEFLRMDWIKAVTRGKTSMRYRITDVGRSWLRRTLDDDAQPAHTSTDIDTKFRKQHQANGEKLFANPTTGKAEPTVVNLGESPIGWLTKRKGPDGKPFLTPEEVEAAERLRRDFELAQMGPSIAQNWQKFLTPGDKYSGNSVPGNAGDGALMARDRFMKALETIGPGLADVAMRTCCFLEGLEACERRMGWSARSGKVVLKLALQRLADHYGLIVFKD